MGAIFATAAIAAYSRLLGRSFADATGRALIAGMQPSAQGFPRALFQSPLPLVSHGTEDDPVFRYANHAALNLWEMGWEAFTTLPSRLSAEDDPAIQTDRSRYLREAAERGWVADYQGIRVSATGKRFRISQTVLWTVRDAAGVVHGQAALIGQVTPL